MQPVGIDDAEHYRWGEGCDGWHLLRSPELSVIQERVPAGRAETLHFHRRARQFFYILRGTARLVVDGQPVALRTGQGVHVAANVPHRFENDSQADVEFLVISTPPSHGDREDIG